MFDNNAETKGEPIYFIASATGIQTLQGAKAEKFFDKIDSTHTVRVTNSSSLTVLINKLQSQGAQVVTAHWHDMGIKKGLEPEELVTEFLKVDEKIFKPVVLREDITSLRQMIGARYAVLDFRRAAQLKLSAIVRDLGIGDNEALPEWLEASKEDLKAEEKSREKPIEREITKLAKKIPECILLNEILGIKGDSWMTSASVVAYIGDIERFPTVSALWAYSGNGVVEGKAPKRTKGQTQNWNAKLRTTLWSWCDSMLKVKNPTWRPVYEKYAEEEMTVHLSKCSACSALPENANKQKEKKTLVVQSHSRARARRRVVKDVLKKFYLRMKKESVLGAVA